MNSSSLFLRFITLYPDRKQVKGTAYHPSRQSFSILESHALNTNMACSGSRMTNVNDSLNWGELLFYRTTFHNYGVIHWF